MTSLIDTHCNTEKNGNETRIWAKGQIWNMNRSFGASGVALLEAMLKNNEKFLDADLVAHLIKCAANNQ